MGLPEGVGFGEALELAGAAGKLQAVDLEFDPNSRYNLWSGLIGGTFLALAYFGTDQSQVQRYLTAESITQSRFSLLFNGIVKVPLQFVILLTGAMVFVFFLFIEPPMLFHGAAADELRAARGAEYSQVERTYQDAFEARRVAALDGARNGNMAPYLAADERLQAARGQAISLAEESTGEPYNDTNYIFLTFVINHLPPGLVGLIIAAVFAAAMSTISAELNSLATVTVVDHYARYIKPGAGDGHYRNVAIGATVFWGLYATMFAGYGAQLGSLIEAVNRVGSWFYGAMLGAFMLAFAPWKSNGTGVFVGILAGLAAAMATELFTDVAFLWFNVIGCLTTVGVGLLLSRGRE